VDRDDVAEIVDQRGLETGDHVVRVAAGREQEDAQPLAEVATVAGEVLKVGSGAADQPVDAGSGHFRLQAAHAIGEVLGEGHGVLLGVIRRRENRRDCRMDWAWIRRNPGMLARQAAMLRGQ